MTSEHTNWIETGWFGVVVKTPPDWNLGAFSGDDTEGYYRVDSPDGAAVEIRWQTKKGSVDLEGVREQYCKKLTKNSKKTKIPIEFSKKPKILQGIRPAGRVPLIFGWTADRQAVGAIWACPKCDKVVIGQVMWPLDKGKVPAAEILDSIQDHPVEGISTWSLYGLNAKIPSDFKIVTKPKLMSGYMRLDLVRKSSKLTVERWGLADIALRDATLSKWIHTKDASLQRGFKLKEQEISIHDDNGISLEGAFKNPFKKLKVWLLKTIRLKPVSKFKAIAWRCEDANRIFCITGVLPKDEDTVEMVTDSIHCH